MLVMFKAKNFLSFQNEVVFDMRATTLREHPLHIANKCDMKILKTNAVFGANSSGKTNLINALWCYKQYIKNQLFNDVNEEAEYIPTIKMNPFSLTAKPSEDIELEMIFESRETLYQYGFAHRNRTIKSEWLSVNDQIVFEREGLDIIPGKKYKALLKDCTRLREDRLFISVLDYFSVDEMKGIVDGFKDFINTGLCVLLESNYSNTNKTIIFDRLSKRLSEDDILRKKIARYLQLIDAKIIDLDVTPISVLDRRTGFSEDKEIIEIIREIYDDAGKKAEEARFEIDQESTGVVHFLLFIQNALVMLKNGGTLVVDDLTANLHPLVTRSILSLFQSPDNNSAQLIFTTHDVSLLKKDIFRRDEITFVDKNKMGESSLYTLSDLKVRSDALYDKDYFNGKYGAIPIVRETIN